MEDTDTSTIVIIERDYSESSVARFIEECPLRIQEKVDKEVVIDMIKQINIILWEASQPKAGGVLFTLINTLAFGILEFLITNPLERALRRIDDLLTVQNEKVFHPRGLHMVSPRKTALLQGILSFLKCLQDSSIAVSLRREASQKLVEAIKRVHRKSAEKLCDELYEALRSVEGNLLESVASLGDYETQSNLLLALFIHQRMSKSFNLSTGIFDTLLELMQDDSIAVHSTSTKGTIRKSLNWINSHKNGQVSSFKMLSATVFGSVYECTENELWLDFNVESITTSLQDNKGPVLVEIEYECIIHWALDHGYTLKIGTNRSAGISEFKLMDLRSLCAAVELLQRKAKSKEIRRISKSSLTLICEHSGPLVVPTQVQELPDSSAPPPPLSQTRSDVAESSSSQQMVVSQVVEPNIFLSKIHEEPRASDKVLSLNLGPVLAKMETEWQETLQRAIRNIQKAQARIERHLNRSKRKLLAKLHIIVQARARPLWHKKEVYRNKGLVDLPETFPEATSLLRSISLPEFTLRAPK